jgi:hypothetical protein
MDSKTVRAESQNKAFWDELAPVHYMAYDIPSLRRGISAIDPIQQAELYPVVGKRIAHLILAPTRCHSQWMARSSPV